MRRELGQYGAAARGKRVRRGLGWLAVMLGFAATLSAQTPGPTPGAEEDVSALPEKILSESFPGWFEPIKTEQPFWWSADLTGDGQEDLIVLARSKKAVPNAWQQVNIKNPPYEFEARSEILENPLFEPKYAIRPGESYIVVFHGKGPGGWRNLSVGLAFILQDIAEPPPKVTSFGEGEDKAMGLEFRYEGEPGLLYWAGDKYVAAMTEE